MLEIDRLIKQTEKLSPDVKQSRKVVKSLLDQGNLSPFTLQTRPVYANYAQALSLVPLPTALILVDPSSPTFDLIYENCHVMNPGRFYRNGKISYLEYYPGTRTAKQKALY
ncbi:unnamed protein product [Ambrosiozyma monospora]|uniref:Unnamed protein product n=1 Tax=Ambrosiozyma monospora TaxID=43982 RepID=A0ACB5SZV1_AMBMO|nr:unnamed protein product [Ambrosiozyma monospora]